MTVVVVKAIVVVVVEVEVVVSKTHGGHGPPQSTPTMPVHQVSGTHKGYPDGLGTWLLQSVTA